MSLSSGGKLTWRGKFWWGALGAAFAAIVALPMAHLAIVYTSMWTAIAAMSAFLGTGFACLFVYAYRDFGRMRRLEYAANCVIALCNSLPRRTDGETVAVIQEIGARYDEVRREADEFDDKGIKIPVAVYKMRARISRLCRSRPKSLLHAEANASGFRAAMRRLDRADNYNYRVPRYVM